MMSFNVNYGWAPIDRIPSIFHAAVVSGLHSANDWGSNKNLRAPLAMSAGTVQVHWPPHTSSTFPLYPPTMVIQAIANCLLWHGKMLDLTYTAETVEAAPDI